MGKRNTNFEQFKGPGQAYAPKVSPPRRAPAATEPAPAPAQTGPSEEDVMRTNLTNERRMKPQNPRAQSTDHMN